MSGGFLDRQRAEKMMAERGLDALVLSQPETIRYATGAFAGVASFWRRAGAAFVLVPGDARKPMTAIIGDLQAANFREQSRIADIRTHSLWVETSEYHPVDGPSDDVAADLVNWDMAQGKQPGKNRPGTFDARVALGHLRDALGEHGLLKGRIGLELAFVPTADFPLFGAMMPDATFPDCSDLVARLRAIKCADEINILRTAAELSMAGMQALLAQLQPGLDSAAMTKIWRSAVSAESRRRSLPLPGSDWAYIAVGRDGFAPGGPAQRGDLVKIDTGCVIDGYSSDGGRSAVIGSPNRAQRIVYDALHRGFDVGLAMFGPGVPLATVYEAVARAIRNQGFLTYGRGHFGHGVGASIWSEEWPFISSDSDAFAEPGMVLAFETPYYVRGLGGFIIEDQILIKDDGIEIMAPAPRDLFEVSVQF